MRRAVEEDNMPYKLTYLDGQPVSDGLGKIVCVGRNYAEHAKELNNPIPTEPVLFIKPSTAAVPFEKEIEVPDSGCHYELELAFLIQSTLKNANPDDVLIAIGGFGLALDLTKRELQSTLKSKGLPWELAKAFDGSCPVSNIVPISMLRDDIDKLTFSLSINGEQVQRGEASDMLNPTLHLISYISGHFTLEPGDMVLTGTPKGVGPLPKNATIRASLDGYFEIHTLTR